jgi:hypothetical protein
MTKLLELRGVVEASSDAVADVLLDVGPGGRSPLAVTRRRPASPPSWSS